LAAELTAAPEEQGHWLPELHAALGRYYREGHYSGRIFASETQGDYLVWALPADLPVLAYTHAHLFPPEHWEACRRVEGGGPGWRDLLDRLGVNLVVIEPDLHPDLARLLRQDPDWQPVLDEGGDRSIPDAANRHFIALRKQPEPAGTEPRAGSRRGAVAPAAVPGPMVRIAAPEARHPPPDAEVPRT
jgi:hypothetical protein